MKKDIDEMENFFSKYPFCFLVSPDGIIFLSSTPAMVLKSFWPLDNAVRETLIASRQFGNQPFDAVFKTASVRSAWRNSIPSFPEKIMQKRRLNKNEGIKRKKILIVDDDASIGRRIGRHLESMWRWMRFPGTGAFCTILRL